MMRLATGLLVSLVAAALWGQSLTEVAKKEKERRKTNEQKGVPVRAITENDIAPKTPAPSSAEAEPNEGEESQTESFQLVLEKPPAPTPAGPPNLGPAPDFDLPDRTGKLLSLKRLQGKTGSSGFLGDLVCALPGHDAGSGKPLPEVSYKGVGGHRHQHRR